MINWHTPLAHTFVPATIPYADIAFINLIAYANSCEMIYDYVKVCVGLPRAFFQRKGAVGSKDCCPVSPAEVVSWKGDGVAGLEVHELGEFRGDLPATNCSKRSRASSPSCRPGLPSKLAWPRGWRGTLSGGLFPRAHRASSRL